MSIHLTSCERANEIAHERIQRLATRCDELALREGILELKLDTTKDAWAWKLIARALRAYASG